jgi:hypothetical protein
MKRKWHRECEIVGVDEDGIIMGHVHVNSKRAGLTNLTKVKGTPLKVYLAQNGYPEAPEAFLKGD